jgi:stage II sporulation protein D
MLSTASELRTRRSLLRAGLVAWSAGLIAPWSEPWCEASRNVSGEAEAVRIGVLGLFHPQQLRLIAGRGSALDLRLDGQSHRVAGEPVTIGLHGGAMEVQLGAGTPAIPAVSLRAIPEASPVDSGAFWLEVPGKLKRQYAGRLEICPHGAALAAIVTMPLETAVASVVSAESPPGATTAALEAQAVAARSFLAARQAGHADFDFCDTTHCQFLRSPPEPGSGADEAARSTRGLVLTWHEEAANRDRTLAAMYARSCDGRTRSLREIGVRGEGYPYYAVPCEYCGRHPELLQRDGEVPVRSERERLAFNRIHGWGAVPSLPAESANDAVHGSRLGGSGLGGRGVGHGIGLCQLGAADMARRGASFAQILAHYYPNTMLRNVREL